MADARVDGGCISPAAASAVAEAIRRDLESRLLGRACTLDGRFPADSRSSQVLHIYEVIPPSQSELVGYWTAWRVGLEDSVGSQYYCSPAALLSLRTTRALFRDHTKGTEISYHWPG